MASLMLRRLCRFPSFVPNSSLRLLATDSPNSPLQGGGIGEENANQNVSSGDVNISSSALGDSRGYASAVAEKVVDTADEIGEKARQTAQDAWSSAKDKTRDIQESVADKAEESKESIKEAAKKVERSMNTKET